MATAPLQRPALWQNNNPVVFQRAAVSDGSNTIAASQFVKLTASNPASPSLTAYVADDAVVFGLCLDASTTSTTEPYLSPWGENHNVVTLVGTTFLMNITDGSGTIGSGTTTQGDIGLGSRYSARYAATVDTSALCVDVSDTGTASKHIFQVVQKYPYDATADFNGRVMVTIVPSAIQPQVAT